jgi:hypothetical protein
MNIAAFNCATRLLERNSNSSFVGCGTANACNESGGSYLSSVRRGYEMPNRAEAVADIFLCCKRALAYAPRLWWACRAVFFDGAVDISAVPPTVIRLIGERCGAALVKAGIVSVRNQHANNSSYLSQLSRSFVERLTARDRKAQAREIRIASADLRRKRKRDRDRAAARYAESAQSPARASDLA